MGQVDYTYGSHNERYGNACVPNAFDITVVKLIDGYLGQVVFGGQIVHQTDLFQDNHEETGSSQAYKAANAKIIEAVKGLFK